MNYLILFPNPFSNELQLLFFGRTEESVHLKIFNTLGKVVLSKTDFQQKNVRLQEIEFGAQSHHLPVFLLQDIAVQARQLLDELLRQIGIYMHQRRQDAEAVEQEMRVDLRSEQVDFADQLLFFQLLCLVLKPFRFFLKIQHPD